MIVCFWQLLRILILISPFKASTSFSLRQLPKQNDFDETYLLTLWMTNTTTKNIIQEYLILCPEQDMCLGSMFKRGYPFFDKSACTPCECDDSCVRRSTCCPSKFYRQTDTPDFIEYQKNISITEKETPMSCFEPLWNPKGIRSKRSYWMIKTCPNNINCISPPSINISSSTPVTSLATNQTYCTIQCALCNHEEMSSLVEWEKKKFCNLRSALFAKEDVNSLYQSVFSLNPLCNIGFYPSTFYEDKVQPCVKYTHEDKCNESKTENNVVNAYLIKACQEFYLPYIFYNIIYKNIYCALCEHDITNLPIQYFSGKELGKDFLPNPFSALIDFQQIPDEPIIKSLACAKNQMLDNRLVSF
uniref:SMB domain-containing protein n=1 Tax=Magallana gigas TaxID=29159 RepID=A0A8W8KDJ4_MAGGI